MNEIIIKDKEQAETIIKAWNDCSMCSECKLNSPEGWKCSYLKEKAEKYLKKNK